MINWSPIISNFISLQYLTVQNRKSSTVKVENMYGKLYSGCECFVWVFMKRTGPGLALLVVWVTRRSWTPFLIRCIISSTACCLMSFSVRLKHRSTHIHCVNVTSVIEYADALMINSIYVDEHASAAFHQQSI